MGITNRGVLARLVAGGAAAATAVAGMTVGLAAPAHAVPVNVTTTLTDQAGNALDGYVEAYALQSSGFFTRVASQYVADGVVNLPVEPGTYKFAFGDEDGLFVSEYYHDRATLETADAVGVGGPTTLAPVSLAARPAVSGQAVSPTGKPVRSGYVNVYDAATDGYRGRADIASDGTFRVGVDAGTYKLEINGSGFVREFLHNKADLVSADHVAVGAGGASVGQVVLSRGSVVQGGVTSSTGAPLERAQVTIYGDGSRQYSDGTDASGTYRIENVPPGTYKVRFTDPVGEYLSEWHSDKADQASADAVAVGVDATVTVNAALANDPAAAIDPATVDVSGTVVDSSGAKVIGASVTAWDTPSDGDAAGEVSTVRTNRAGQYFFTRLDRAYSSEDSVKVEVRDTLSREEGQYERLDRWYGGTQGYDKASVAPVPAGNVNVTLPLTGGIAGTVTSGSDLGVDGVAVTFLSVAENDMLGATGVEEDGTYATTGLVPGTYKVRFLDYGSYVGEGYRSHAPEWYGSPLFAKAKTVTVTSGKTVSGIDVTLEEQLKAMRRPEIKGKPYLGGKVSAYPGVWSLRTGTTYVYEWLVDNAVIGTGRTLAITKKLKNERVVLRVTAENGTHQGTALVTSQQLQLKPEVKVALTGSRAVISVAGKNVKAAKIKGTVVAKRIVRKDDLGAPVYKRIGKAKLRSGRAAVTLTKLKKGKNKVVFFIKVKGKLGDATVMRVVKLRR